MKNPSPSYHGFRFPFEIISHAVWLYPRFCLSFREVEELLTQRGLNAAVTLGWRSHGNHRDVRLVDSTLIVIRSR